MRNIITRYRLIGYILIMLFGITLFKTYLDIQKIINTSPDARLKPVKFFDTGVRDPQDLTSTFFVMGFELKNYGKKLAKDVKMEMDVRSKSRPNFKLEGYFSYDLEPNQAINFERTFVMNPDDYKKRYIEGEDTFDVYVTVNYKDEKKKIYNYEGTWKYKKAEFYLVKEKDDIVDRPKK